MIKRLLLALVFPAILWAQTPTPTPQRQLVEAVLLDDATMWLDADNTASITQTDTAVSAWASRVGAISFTQSTAANKPAWTRADNLENRIYASEALNDAAYWNQVALTSVTAVADPLGGSTAWRCAVDGTTGNHVIRPHASYPTPIVTGQSYRTIFWARKNAGARPNIYLDLTGSAIDTGGSINLDTGATSVIWTTGTSARTLTATDQGGGWYKIVFELTASADSATARNYIFLGSSSSYGGAGEEYDIYHPQFQSSLADSTYLATTTYTQYRGINGRRAIRFDGNDDYLATASDPSINSNLTVFTVFRPVSLGGGSSGRILDNANSHQNLYTGGTNALGFSGDVNVTTAYSANNSIAFNTNYIANLIRTSAGAATFYINGALSGTAAQSSGVPDPVTTLVIGNRTSSVNRGFHGDIAEIITWNRVLSAQERAGVTRYLAYKYGVTL